MNGLWIILLSIGICSSNFIVYYRNYSDIIHQNSSTPLEDMGLFSVNILNSSYSASYSDWAFVPPINRLYYLTSNISDCDENSVLVSRNPYTPICRDDLLSKCAGVMLVDREIYYGVSSPQTYPELSGLLNRKFVILTPSSSVSQIRDLVNKSLTNRSIILSRSNSSTGSSEENKSKIGYPMIQIGYTAYSPWHDNLFEQYTIRICLAAIFFLLGFLTRIYDLGIRDAGKYLFLEWSISSILHALVIVYTILGICFIIDPLYSVGIFSPRVGVIISSIYLCIPAPCMLVLALYWKDALTEIRGFNILARYGSTFILVFSIIGGVMIILAMCGAFVSDMKDFYPYIRAMATLIAIINGITLILYIACISAVFVGMSRSGINVQTYVIITQILVFVGVISQIVGSIISLSGLSDSGNYSGYYNSYKWLSYRLGEVLCLLAVSRQLGGFIHNVDIKKKIDKQKKSGSSVSSNRKSNTVKSK